MKTRSLRIAADDGYFLGGTLFETAGGNNEVCVLICNALGVTQARYATFARFLAEQGFTVLTCDYRGVGASVRPDWRGAPPTLRDWGSRDLPAMIDWLSRERPGYGVVSVGHVFGGHALGLAWNNDRVRGLLGISASLSYFRLWPLHQQPWRWILHRYLLPLRLRMFEQGMVARAGMPASVLESWHRLCLSPQPVCDDLGRPLPGHFQDFRGRLRLYCFADDRRQAPRRAVEALGRAYMNAGVELVSVQARDWGLDRFGHFSFFSDSAPRAAWQDAADWLLGAGRIPKPPLIEV